MTTTADLRNVTAGCGVSLSRTYLTFEAIGVLNNIYLRNASASRSARKIEEKLILAGLKRSKCLSRKVSYASAVKNSQANSLKYDTPTTRARNLFEVILCEPLTVHIEIGIWLRNMPRVLCVRVCF